MCGLRSNGRLLTGKCLIPLFSTPNRGRIRRRNLAVNNPAHPPLPSWCSFSEEVRDQGSNDCSKQQMSKPPPSPPPLPPLLSPPAPSSRNCLSCLPPPNIGGLEDDRERPFKPWRLALKYPICWCLRFQCLLFGFWWISVSFSACTITAKVC